MFENLDIGEIMKNFTRDYSPIIMNKDWPWLWRLVFMAAFTAVGTLMNTFFISAFFISSELKKKENVYLACLGFTDLIITAIVVPIVIVVMFGYNESTELCKVLQFLTQGSTYSYSIFYMLVARNTHTRQLRGWYHYPKCLKNRHGTGAVLNYFISYMTAGAGVYFELDYDYCNRMHFGNFWFRFITSMIFYVIPFLVTMFLLVDTTLFMKNRVVALVMGERYRRFQADKKLTHSHLGCYLLFVAAWIPYLVLVNKYPDASDAKYYAMIWIGVVRSAITSIIYSTLNCNFRKAFYTLFCYCCCKVEIPQPSNGRQRNRMNRDTNEVPRIPHTM